MWFKLSEPKRAKREGKPTGARRKRGGSNQWAGGRPASLANEQGCSFSGGAWAVLGPEFPHTFALFVV